MKRIHRTDLETAFLRGSLTISAALAAFVVSVGHASAAEVVKIDGSSTVFPITEAMAEEFQKAEKGATQVTVGISGTGGGFKKFCRGETDIADASRPIKDSERAVCKEAGIEFVELPIAFDALAVVVNPKNTWVDHLTVDELKVMWEPAAQAKITSWKQIRPSFPDKPLRLFGAGVDSGTYDYFTEAIVGKAQSSRGDFTASEDDNVLVQGIANDVNALGFFGFAYYHENQKKLKAIPIAWKGGKPQPPSFEGAKSGTYQPLSRPIFIYVAKKSAETKPHVKRFVEFYLNDKNAQALVKEVGYVPLPSEAYAKARETFRKLEVGTAFHGAEVGIDINDLLTRKKNN
jgi:phosphate transport system substrate-binding protein